jgi:hypothetical protein
MCDRIKEDDDRMKGIKDLKCNEENKGLEMCLNKNDRDFRKCQEQLKILKNCMVNSVNNESKT